MSKRRMEQRAHKRTEFFDGLVMIDSGGIDVLVEATGNPAGIAHSKMALRARHIL